MRAAILAASVAVVLSPAAGARDLRFRCIEDTSHGRFSARVRIGPTGEAECYSLDGELCQSACEAGDSKPWTPPANRKGRAIRCSKFGESVYADPSSWCRIVCQTFPGCAHKSVAERQLPVAPPAPKRAPPPPPPAEIGGQGPCKEDADCSVETGRSCCGCQTLEVRSRLHPVEPPPACGCADLGQLQRGPHLEGIEPESFGPCGRPPPPSSDYRAVCRQNACVGVHR
jgi:hypothetical protein